MGLGQVAESQGRSLGTYKDSRRLASHISEGARRVYPFPLVAVDLAAIAVAFTLGAMARNTVGEVVLDQPAIATLGLISAVSFFVFAHFAHLYRGRYIVGVFDEVISAAGTWLGAAAIASVVNAIAFSPRVPLSVLMVGVLLTGAIMLSTRAGWRLLNNALNRPNPHGRTKVVVFGAGEGGEIVVRSMLGDPASQYVPIAVLDDDKSQHNRRIAGLRVSGTRDAIGSFAEDADALLIAIPSARSELLADLSAFAELADLDVMVLPTTSELFGSMLTHETVRPLEVEDLLGRAQVEIDHVAVAGYLTGETVLVTGAGGSIGSELCRQIATYNPERLVMVDRDETALQSLQLSIHGHGLFGDENLVLADIRDRARMFELFGRFRPKVVFHAAALKHLSMLEANPSEAVETNVFGTKNVIDAACSVDAEHFVNISTDKAANPISVLGETKRIAEALTVEAASESIGHFVNVRFGNVLGSRGSVLPLFEAQIEAGLPLSVTDPDATRYFMSIPEASGLVLQAGAIGKTGETMVLDMGEPVNIHDLALRLLKHRGSDVDIRITGLRESEKLHEELTHDGELLATREHHRVWHTAPVVSPVSAHLDRLRVSDTEMLRTRMSQLIRGFSSEIDLSSSERRIYLSPPHLSAVERTMLIDAFDSNWVASVGPDLNKFEAELSGWSGREHTVAVSSGTAALHLSLLLAGVVPGDDVLVSSMTFVATANAILQSGGNPVLVDSSHADWNIDPDLIAQALAERARAGRLPKAVVAVDLYGQCADYQRLEQVCSQYDVALVLDSAESLGAQRDGRPAGSCGLVAALSFNGNKIITTGGGGALATDDPDLAERALFLATQARLPAEHYQHSEPGFNYRLSNLAAAIGVGQLERLPEMIARRALIGERYRAALSTVPGIGFMPVPAGSRPNSWLHVITVDPEIAGIDRTTLYRALANRNIESRPSWKPMHLQPLFAGVEMIGGQVSRQVFETGLCLPSGSGLSNADIDRVIDVTLSALTTSTTSLV